MIRILGMLALILILFEGGLELRLKEAIRYCPGGLLLAIVSYSLTLGLVAAVVRFTLPCLGWTPLSSGLFLDQPAQQWCCRQSSRLMLPRQSKSP